MRKIFAIAAAMTLCVAAFAQNGNHTVEVTNDYISQLSGLQKKNVEMAVPDSLLHFDYKFDYSVFDTPYKGAYEFSPYQIHVQPQASKYDAGKFYLRAGAGYSIRPVLEFVAAAVTKPEFALTIYNEGTGFYGRNVWHELKNNPDPFTGYDASDRFGIGARWILPKFVTKLDLGYDLIAAGDEANLANTMTHSGSVALSVAPVGSPGFDYLLNAGARYSAGTDPGNIKNSEVLASVGGMVGFGIGSGSRLKVDFELATDMFNVPDLSDMFGNMALFSATPSYNFSKGPFAIKLGARLDYSTEKNFTVAPDARISANLLDDKLTFYAGADGGQSLASHFGLKSASHRASTVFSAPGINNELVHGFVGFTGHASHVFEWGLQAGYHNWKSKACESLMGFNYAHVSLMYVDGRFALKTERVDFDGDFRVAKSDLLDIADIFSTPMVSGNVRLMYNQNKRFYAGVWAEGQTGRNGLWEDGNIETTLPGWINVGVSAEYKVSTKWGVWLEGGNLACQEIWRNPLFAEKDPYVTLGICLKF